MVVGGFVLATFLSILDTVQSEPGGVEHIRECTEVSASLATTRTEVQVGEKPQFALTLRNVGGKPVRVLDVRKGRRPDLQDNYFELVGLEDGRPVRTPIAISDPGPLSDSDFFELQPGQQATIERLSYKRELTALPPGDYEAAVLVWRDPMQPSATRCRSKGARFTVQK